MELKSYAKINLTLNVLGKRKDNLIDFIERDSGRKDQFGKTLNILREGHLPKEVLGRTAGGTKGTRARISSFN